MLNKNLFRISNQLKLFKLTRNCTTLTENKVAINQQPISEVQSNENNQQKSLLDKNEEDLSHIAPYLKPTFNFAAYVNKSITLQELLKLGIDLHKVEKVRDALPFILQLDFEKDVKNHIIFLHDLGLEIETIGAMLTKNPFLFKEDTNDLQTRINYLEYRKFSKEQILRIISVNPFWLSHNTQDIDNKLGFFQQKFKFTGNEVRELTVKQPKLITYSQERIKQNTFALVEEMGFSANESKQMLLDRPKLYMLSPNKVLKIFDYLHRELKVSLELLAQQPDLLTHRLFKIKQRHLFLERLGKAQYDPKQPGYISLLTIVSATESDFCVNIAKSTMDAYNTFLKTM